MTQTHPVLRSALRAAGAALVLVLPALPCSAPAQDVDGLAAAAALEQAFVEVIAETEPSVVSILRYRPQRSLEFDAFDPFRRPPQDFDRIDPLRRPPRDIDRFGLLHRQQQEEQRRAAEPEHPDFVPNEFGSGIIIQGPDARNERLILTNYHVVKGGPVFGQPQPEQGQVRLYVRFANRHGCQAAIFAADPRSDLAVLKLLPDAGDVWPAELRPMPLGDGSGVRKGQLVLALGNPYAMARDGSASAAWGMVSNVGRRAAPIEDAQFDSEARKRETVHHYGTLLQVSIPLDLGTSGGPLLNLRGELIGITTSLAALDGYEKSVGHAVPLDDGTRRVIETLSRGHEVEYGLLGIAPETLLRQGVPGMDQPSAALVSGVRPGSPAAAAGLRDHDAILAVDSVPVYSKSDLMREVGNRPPGSTLRLRVWSPYPRNGEARDLDVTLAKWPPINDSDIIATQERPERMWRGLVVDYGTARNQFTPRQEQFDVVLVRKVSAETRTFAANSTSERVELQPGDFITHVEGQPVRTPDEFARVVENLTGDVRLTLSGRPDVIVRP